MTNQVIIGLLIPFIGTSLGAAFVFCLRKEISDGIQRMLTGFAAGGMVADRKSTRLNSSHQIISYAVFCSKKKTPRPPTPRPPRTRDSPAPPPPLRRCL